MRSLHIVFFRIYSLYSFRLMHYEFNLTGSRNFYKFYLCRSDIYTFYAHVRRESSSDKEAFIIITIITITLIIYYYYHIIEIENES